MRNITHIVIHCTATQPTARIENIQRYWRVTLGWSNPGYHYMIEADGQIHNIHPVDRPSNGVAGHNAKSIHIAYIGGIDKAGKPLDTRTPRQIVSLLALITTYRDLYPTAEVLGHRDFPRVAKACPSFDVRQWLAGTNIINAEKNLK